MENLGPNSVGPIFKLQKWKLLKHWFRKRGNLPPSRRTKPATKGKPSGVGGVGRNRNLQSTEERSFSGSGSNPHLHFHQSSSSSIDWWDLRGTSACFPLRIVTPDASVLQFDSFFVLFTLIWIDFRWCCDCSCWLDVLLTWSCAVF